MSGRNSQISRIYAILGILEGAPQGLSVSEIAGRVASQGHQASQRTIYRDLEALNQAGFPLFPLEDSDGPATRWKLEKLTRVTEHFVLSARELLALFMGRGCLSPLRDTPFFADLESVFKKIEAKLGTKGQEYLASLTSEIEFEPGPRWGLGLDPDVLETVRAACAERQALSVTYKSAHSGEKKKRKLGPHCLYFAQGSLYLLAQDLESGQNKVFALPRMSEAAMVDEAFGSVPLDPESFFQASLGVFQGDTPEHVRIAFSSVISPYVKERRWHSSQSVVSKADGSIVLQLDVSLTPELVNWILGFGPNARVLEPRALAQKIHEAASRVLALYSKDAA